MLIANVIFFNLYSIYRVSSDSMVPTLMASDIIIVKKISAKSKHGHRNLNNKICVFILNKESNQFIKENGLYVKRIVGSPGDTLQFRDSELYINSFLVRENVKEIKANSLDRIRSAYNFGLENNYYWSNSSWDGKNFGPLCIPRMDASVYINDSVSSLYPNIIFKEVRDVLQLDIKTPFLHKFQNDYYFTMGDNRNMSVDSRHFGPIPFDSIVGQVKRVLFSWSKSNPFFISRILKKIE